MMGAPARLPTPADKSLRLVALGGASAREFRLAKRRIAIGADAANDLVIADSTVSGWHAVIRRRFGALIIADLGSTNGTCLNGKRISRPAALKPGDEVKFGAARFAVAGSIPLASRANRYLALAASIVALAAVGFLAAQFVLNWSSLEQAAENPSPAATPPSRGAQARTESPPVAASAAATTPVPGPQPDWLKYVNGFRAMVKLAPVSEDPMLSGADRKHAVYLVKNYEDRVGPGALVGADMHSEDPSKPYYTPEGLAAAERSDVNQLWGVSGDPSPTWAIQNWMEGPFHRMWILNPALRRVGYGQFCEKSYCVAALDVGDGIEHVSGAAPLARPILFPPDGSTLPINSFQNEWPNPLTGCAGYSFPAGLPITIQTGARVDAELSNYSIARDGSRLPACGIDAANYSNPDASAQGRARQILRSLGAVVIIPQSPLENGRYEVSATVNGREYKWSFTIAR